MKLIIFGATGTIGRQLLLQGLELGHEVTAFVRDKEKLNDIRHINLRFYQGDVFSYDDVLSAIAHQDAVLCALGNGKKGRVRSEGTRNIVKAMEAAGVKRLICNSTLGAGDSRGNLNFIWKHVMFGWLLKDAYEDHQLQEKYVRESMLDWTIVRPAAFTDGKATGQYRHGFAANDRNITLKISRADVALFMLMQLSSRTYWRKTPGLSY